jgi:helicase required for RNAi-mediated heterochromatin assembly 1
MMANMQPGDPPIIVSAQTNHALDQLLNHILKFEGNILRLGGRSSKENKEIRKRTLYELRQSTKDNVPSKHYLIKSAQRALLNRIEEIQQTMMPLVNFRNIIDVKIFLDRKVITQAQYDSLAGGDWDGDDVDISGFASCE